MHKNYTFFSQSKRKATHGVNHLLTRSQGRIEKEHHATPTSFCGYSDLA
jgi:hypothetical protein